MFTDLNAAIEEARWMRVNSGHHFVVVQSEGGVMTVRKAANLGSAASRKVMFSTKSDKHHTVLMEA